MAHVVVAEPDESIRNLLIHVATLSGWTCDTAASGREAWQLVESVQPDLVIAEVDLGKMSGVELVWSMKQHPALSGIPVVFISSPHRENEARCAGCNVFVPKPFDVKALMQLLTNLAPAERPG